MFRFIFRPFSGGSWTVLYAVTKLRWLMYTPYRFVQYAAVCHYRPFVYAYGVPDWVKPCYFQVTYRVIEKGASRAPSLRIIPWHLPYN